PGARAAMTLEKLGKISCGLLLALGVLLGALAPPRAFAQSAVPPVATALPGKPAQLNIAEDIPKAQFVEGSDSKPTPAANPTPAGRPAGTPPAASEAPEPFGARLFTGNFLRTRQDGLNGDYLVMPGDRIQVNTWGALETSSVLLVDAQGNVFLPNVGPV